jgi:hypothetical protein
MAELTYILGAGASYQSMPVVKTFPKRFEEFTKSVSDLLFGNSTSSFQNLKTDLSEFGSDIKSHQSFDTYFKKLFHTADKDKILKSKKILNLYFLWEHLQASEEVITKTAENKNDPGKIKNEEAFEKQSAVDKRYDALIAGLLKPNRKIEFFGNVNFISWNYDLNLLCSVKSFTHPEVKPNTLINELSSKKGNISDLGKISNIWDFLNGLKIINMNGHFFSSSLDDYDYSSVNAEGILKNKVFHTNDFSIENRIPDLDAERVNFAWEKDLDPDKNPVLLEAKKAIERSDTIVVIGYTFPLYNRLVDLKYFNNKTLSRKAIYIQDPNAIELEYQIKNNFLLEMHGGRVSGIEISPITNCDSFFIPSNIFDPKKIS